MFLGHLLIAESLDLHAPELSAVTIKNLNKISLRLDHRTLFNNQHGHQAVGDDEQHGQNGQKAVLLFWILWRCNRDHCCVSEQSRQVAPQPSLSKQAQRQLQLASQCWEWLEDIESI